jgi:acetyl esterase/lipase
MKYNAFLEIISLFFITFLLGFCPLQAQENYEQAYGFSLKDKGIFNKAMDSGGGPETTVLGQYNGHGVIARLNALGEPITWQSYESLLPSTGSNFTSIVFNPLNNGTITVAGLCKDCMPNRRGQVVVIFRMGTDLKPIAVNGKTFTFIAPAVDTFQAQTTVEMMVNAYDLFVAYEGDSGFGSDVYMSKLDERNFTKIWDKQYNTNFFEVPIILTNDSLNVVGLGLNGWGKTRLLKINSLTGAVLKQYNYLENAGYFAYYGGGRYALVYNIGDRLRVSTINSSGVETDSTYINTNYAFTQAPAIAVFGINKIGVAAHHLEVAELPYAHIKTRVHLLNISSLSTGRTTIDMPTNGAYFRNIKQLIPSSSEFFSLIGERTTDATPRPFFSSHSAFTAAPIVPTTWYNASYCADPLLIEKTASKTFPHTLPYIYNNVQYATKTNFLNKQEKLWMDIYRPFDHYAKKSTEKRPVLIFLHGGGYVGGTEDAGAEFAIQAAQHGMIGISVKYRLGVHPNFGGHLDSLIYYLPDYQKTLYRALQDVRDAVRFVSDNADTYFVDRTKIYLMGHSAGGNAILNYAYIGQNDFPTSLATELGALPAKTPLAGLIPYAAPFSTVNFTTPIDPIRYVDGTENEPIFMIHGSCDSTAFFKRGSPSDPSSPYTVGAYDLTCKKQELNHPYHLAAIKGGDHGWVTEQTTAFESLFKWIKLNSACGVPDRVCETITVPNAKACANITLCPTCRPNGVKENFVTQSEVFPNPMSDALHIRLVMENTDFKQVKVLIYNTLGQISKTEILTKDTEGVYSKQIATAELPDGMFSLKFYGDEKWLGDKSFVKQTK